MKERLYVIGGGGHSAVVIELAELDGYKDIIVCDENVDKHGEKVASYDIIGGVDLIPDSSNVVIAIGNNNNRKVIYDRLVQKSCRFPTLIHPSSVISNSAIIDKGTVVLANVVVNSRAKVGICCILNTSCSIDHDCNIRDFVHISPGVNLAGGVEVDDLSMFGINSCAIPCISVGKKAMIGAGSVVICNVPERVMVCGNPAKEKKRDLGENKLLLTDTKQSA